MTIEAPGTEDIARAENDPALHPYLAAIGEEAAVRALGELIERCIEPRVHEIVGHKLRVAAGRFNEREEIPDLQHEILLQMIARLSGLRGEPGGVPIRNLRSYVAVTAYRACYDYLRRKYPRRYSLKQRVRYLLAHRPEFDCRESEAEQWICGLATWRTEAARDVMGEGRVQRILADASSLKGGAGRSLERLLLDIFTEFQQPIELDALVGIVAEALGVHDASAEESATPEAAERQADPRESIADDLAQRARLGELWKEIARMAPKHRAALLLNLRDDRGGSAIDLFLYSGVVSFSEIAAAMEMTDEELAVIWNRLPLEDAAIAVRLGIARQQVINLRSTARRRLARALRPTAYREFPNSRVS